MVPANHKTMYRRMVYVLIIILLFAVFLRSPYIAPITIQQVANTTPNVMAITLISEFNYSSGTATYLDTIDPYTFSTRNAYVTEPYSRYLEVTGSKDYESTLLNESPSALNSSLASAYSYFESNGSISEGLNSSNPAIVLFSQLTHMAQTGLYQDELSGSIQNPLNETYEIRFLADSKALDSYGTKYGLRTSQWGMLKAGSAWWQIGSYWTAPYNYMEILTAGIPWWDDLENGLVALVAFALLIFFPFIPGLRDIPDKLKLYKIFWNKHTIPEMKDKNRKKR
jgi:hypothetical protein